MSDDTPAPNAFEQATINQLTGVLKLLLMSGGTYLVQKGILEQQDMAEIAAGLAAVLVSFGWMIYARRANGVVKAAANVLDGKGVIVAPPAMAEKLPSNVVGSITEASRVPGVTH
jgi:hypothetical protein